MTDHTVELTDRELAVIRHCLDANLGRRPHSIDDEIVALAEKLPEETHLSRVIP